MQKRLARAGIDTFAPSLLGHGTSTRFDEGLNDPGNASLRAYPPDTTICPYPQGCDRTLVERINPYDQQAMLLSGHPLVERRRHSSKYRFARTDVWVRDIDQVIDYAASHLIASGSHLTNKVALVGYSLGGQHVARTLYADNPNEQLLYADDRQYADDPLNKDLHNRKKVIEKVSRVVFLNSFFGVIPMQPGIGPTEEPADPFGPPTFPLTLNGKTTPVIGSDFNWQMPAGTDEATCPGRVIGDTKQQVWDQTMEQETVGREWGTSSWSGSGSPGGLYRAPTFSGYGWNKTVAGQLRTPTLVIQGLKDGVLPTGPGTGQAIYNYLPEPEENVFNKVLLEVECASHVLQWEGCAGAGCTPPYETLQKALIEWIKNGTYKGAQNGPFTENPSAEASPAP